MERRVSYFEKIEPGHPPITIRWHARGNQGAVGASALLVTLAARLGYGATSAPVFGAEKEGAPITVFNRFAAEEIEAFYTPPKLDVIVIVDPTIAGVTAGSHDKTIFVVNTEKDPEVIARELKLGPARIITVNATTIALAEMKKIGSKAAYPNTTVLGALLHVFPFISLESLSEELHEAYEEKGEKMIGANIAAATRGFKEAKEFDGRGTDIPKAIINPPKLPDWTEILPGGGCPANGSSVANLTGTWRTKRPIRVVKNCTDCLVCVEACPEHSILVTEDMQRILMINLDHCKGCGICAKVCPSNAIGLMDEQRAKKNDSK